MSLLQRRQRDAVAVTAVGVATKPSLHRLYRQRDDSSGAGCHIVVVLESVAVDTVGPTHVSHQ